MNKLSNTKDELKKVFLIKKVCKWFKIANGRYKPRLSCNSWNSLDESFPNTQFNRKEFEISARRDRDKYGGGLIEFVRKGFISQRSREYEAQNCEKEYIQIPNIHQYRFIFWRYDNCD